MYNKQLFEMQVILYFLDSDLQSSIDMLISPKANHPKYT